MRNILWRLRVVVPFLSLPFTAALACPDGQYSQCGPFHMGCICVPNGRTVVGAIDQTPDILNILGSTVHGNINNINQSVGHLVIAASCPGCAVLGQTIMANNDRAFAETVIGRGWLVFALTGDPVLVTVDAATSVAREWQISHPQHNPFMPVPP